MEFKLDQFTVEELVAAFRAGSLSTNPEYQRGASWSLTQKQALVDSVFRGYPMPPLFLEKKVTSGLGRTTNEVHEIIDGQQRVLSLAEYLNDDFDSLKPTDAKLRLPLSLRSAPAPWAGRRFSSLDATQRDRFKATKVLVNLVSGVENPDEVRDLFIRLQSGTALTRQQIRDAWPGALGPRIEQWAGKLRRQPKYAFFTAVDGRGTRDDEDDTNDPFVKHRTTCAQLCALLLRRAQNPFAAPSVTTTELDGLYHEYTTVDPENNPLNSIEVLFDDIEDVVSRIAVKAKGRRKVAKITLFALAMFLQDVHRVPNYRLLPGARQLLAREASEPSVTQNSRSATGGVIRDYYERWRASLPAGVGVELDEKRLFDVVQQQEIFKRDSGLCQVCSEVVEPGDAEYDHFPVPHRDGGRTVIDNGRLVHRACHPRGRPPLD